MQQLKNLLGMNPQNSSMSHFPSSSTNQTQPVTTAEPTTTTAPVPTKTVPNVTNVVTIPVPVVQHEGVLAYITVKGSLHDRTSTVFGLDEMEVQALSTRFGSGVKPVINGIMVSCPPVTLLNTLAELSYKIVCSCGEAEICWTMQREV